MRNWFIILSVALILASCGNDPKKGTDNLNFDENPTEESYTALVNELMSQLRSSETSAADRKTALLKGYEASKQMKKPSQTIGFLNTYVRENFNSEDTPSKILELAAMLKASGKEAVATVLAQGFQQSFPNHELYNQAEALIGQDAPTIEERINELGNSMFNVEEGKLNEDVARSFVDVCEAYAISAPDSEDVPVFLHKAAETARTMRTLPKALSLYDWILDRYADHEKAPQALFLKGFTYDNNLNDIENARKYYEEFLAKYPEDEFADDTQFLLENLGKSDEEMLEALTKKAKK